MNASTPNSPIGSDGRVEHRRRPELLRLRAAGLVGIADDDVGGAIGPSELSEHDADRPCAGDQHPRTAVEARLADRGDADGQRLTQGGGIVGHRIGHPVGVPRTDGDVIAERTVHQAGWRRTACAGTGCSGPFRVSSLSGSGRCGSIDTRCPMRERSDARTDADDRARRLVAEHQRGVDDELPTRPCR